MYEFSFIKSSLDVGMLKDTHTKAQQINKKKEKSQNQAHTKVDLELDDS